MAGYSLWTEMESRSMFMQKKNKPVSSHHDQTSLVSKEFNQSFKQLQQISAVGQAVTNLQITTLMKVDQKTPKIHEGKLSRMDCRKP